MNLNIYLSYYYKIEHWKKFLFQVTRSFECIEYNVDPEKINED